MNQKELNELRRRFRPERSGIAHVYGCFVNGMREVVAETDVSLRQGGAGDVSDAPAQNALRLARAKSQR